MKKNHTKANLGLSNLWLGAIGVVFGDIGTSPLYTMSAVFVGPYVATPTPANVLGVISLIIWSLIMVVCVKYVIYVMRADNQGEGGVMALMAMVLHHATKQSSRFRKVVIALGIFGGALFAGDSIITPAISVLSAIEGIEIATPTFKPYIIPMALAVLFALFSFQKHGTSRVASLFGPIMSIWFAIVGILGIINIIIEPRILHAINPVHGIIFLSSHQWIGLIIMGAVVLALTGAEALYADMGHFGKQPISNAWFYFVMPALLFNYLGQGALIIQNPHAINNPFYLMAPAWALFPLVFLATMATIIASQAVISGTYSMAMQAMKLGFSPRLTTVHTSAEEMGQIYVPTINWVLFIFIVGLVLIFQTSNHLASAYGLAVTGTMIMTTCLISIVFRRIWHWSMLKTIIISSIFFTIDCIFFTANLFKIPHGGWFTLLIAATVALLFTIWRRGRQILNTRLQSEEMSLNKFFQSIATLRLTRVPGTAIFLVSNIDTVPHALIQNINHNKILHERVCLLTVVIEDVPRISKTERLDIEILKYNFHRVVVRFGFKEEPDIPKALQLCGSYGYQFDVNDASFFINRETIIPVAKAGMSLWRAKLFTLMARNAGSAEEFFKLPIDRVIELGVQIKL